MESRHKQPLKTILEDSHGCVKPGEMLLVLGRPGSGCTTLLKNLANRREGYAEVTGDVKWGTLDPKHAGQYRGQIVMNTEEELFFPTLTVGQTIDFATRMKSMCPFIHFLWDNMRLRMSEIEDTLTRMDVHMSPTYSHLPHMPEWLSGDHLC